MRFPAAMEPPESSSTLVVFRNLRWALERLNESEVVAFDATLDAPNDFESDGGKMVGAVREDPPEDLSACSTTGGTFAPAISVSSGSLHRGPHIRAHGVNHRNN